MQSLLVRWQAAGDLTRRWAGAIALAWQFRKAFESPPRLPHEAEFLPAALALQETPGSPAPRVAMWLLVLFAALAVGWSVVGRIDMVATARGKIVPSGQVKVVQPFETAIVRAIHVTDGTAVKAGDLLIELDATAATADAARIANDLQAARLVAARSETLSRALRGRSRSMSVVPGVAAHALEDEKQLLESEWGEFVARRDRIDADISRREAALRATRQNVGRLERMVPLTRQRARDSQRLLDADVVSRHGHMEVEQARIQQEGELAAQRESLREIQAALLEGHKQRATLHAETQRAWVDRLRQAEQQAAALAQELVKARQRDRQLRLLAPVDGTVQQLAIHTVGGVVTPAQPLLVVVPRQSRLEVEALVENKDIGFVHAGQGAEVKIETFPYTKFGTLDATVLDVSNDAISDEKLGLVYAARVGLDRATMEVGDKEVNLTPGMAVTVEVKTGKRRVIEFFLSPLLRYQRESLRER